MSCFPSLPVNVVCAHSAMPTYWFGRKPVELWEHIVYLLGATMVSVPPSRLQQCVSRAAPPIRGGRPRTERPMPHGQATLLTAKLAILFSKSESLSRRAWCSRSIHTVATCSHMLTSSGRRWPKSRRVGRAPTSSRPFAFQRAASLTQAKASPRVSICHRSEKHSGIVAHTSSIATSPYT